MVTIHGTCVLVGGIGVLLRGPSGAGKSDVALRLIDGGALLVADDRVELRMVDGRLMASAPAALAGLLEVRGLGIVRLPCDGPAEVGLVVDLVAAAEVERSRWLWLWLRADCLVDGTRPDRGKCSCSAASSLSERSAASPPPTVAPSPT